MITNKFKRLIDKAIMTLGANGGSDELLIAINLENELIKYEKLIKKYILIENGDK